MKVYALFEGQYSDRELVGVYDDLDAAKTVYRGATWTHYPAGTWTSNGPVWTGVRAATPGVVHASVEIEEHELVGRAGGMSKLQTRELLADSYAWRGKALGRKKLTNAVLVNADGEVTRVMCDKVRLDSIADAGANSAGLTEQPTCGRCRSRTRAMKFDR